MGGQDCTPQCGIQDFNVISPTTLLLRNAVEHSRWHELVHESLAVHTSEIVLKIVKDWVDVAKR